MPDEQEDPGVRDVERLHNPHNIRRMPDRVVVADCPRCHATGQHPYASMMACDHCNGLGVVQVR